MGNVTIQKGHSCFLEIYITRYVTDKYCWREKNIYELLQPCSLNTKTHTPYDIQLIWQLAVALPGGS